MVLGEHLLDSDPDSDSSRESMRGDDMPHADNMEGSGTYPDRDGSPGLSELLEDDEMEIGSREASPEQDIEEALLQALTSDLEMEIDNSERSSEQDIGQVPSEAPKSPIRSNMALFNPSKEPLNHDDQTGNGEPGPAIKSETKSSDGNLGNDSGTQDSQDGGMMLRISEIETEPEAESKPNSDLISSPWGFQGLDTVPKILKDDPSDKAEKTDQNSGPGPQEPEDKDAMSIDPKLDRISTKQPGARKATSIPKHAVVIDLTDDNDVDIQEIPSFHWKKPDKVKQEDDADVGKKLKSIPSNVDIIDLTDSNDAQDTPASGLKKVPKVDEEDDEELESFLNPFGVKKHRKQQIPANRHEGQARTNIDSPRHGSPGTFEFKHEAKEVVDLTSLDNPVRYWAMNDGNPEARSRRPAGDDIDDEDSLFVRQNDSHDDDDDDTEFDKDNDSDIEVLAPLQNWNQNMENGEEIEDEDDDIPNLEQFWHDAQSIRTHGKRPLYSGMDMNPDDESDDYHEGTFSDDDNESVSTVRGPRNAPGGPSLNPDKRNPDVHGDSYETVTQRMNEMRVKRNKIEAKMTKGTITPTEIQELVEITKTMAEDVGKLSSFPNASQGGRIARNSKEYWEQYNKTRKGAISKKRKMLSEMPVPKNAPSQGAKRRRKNSTAKSTEASDKSQRNFLSMVGKLNCSNPMKARMARGDVEASSGADDITATTKKNWMVQVMGKVATGCNEKTMKADKQRLDTASKSFGLGKCKPVGNRWLIEGIILPLYHHQLLGSSWMLEHEHGEDKGGIVADEMGMGKTAQCLATIVSNRPEQKDIKEGRKATLIVVPATSVPQWEAEIEKFTDENFIENTMTFKASLRPKLRQLRKSNIIVTSYSEVTRSFIPLKVLREMRSEECNEKRQEELKKQHLGDLFQVPFHRVILDEAHCIKNPKSLTSLACRELDGTYRWAVTGTPLHNSLDELWSYLSFLDVDWALSYKSFQDMTKNLEHETNRKRLQSIIENILIRRTLEDDTIFGQQVYTIPNCEFETKIIPLTEEEKIIYRVLEDRYRRIINWLLKKLRRENPGQIVRYRDLKVYLVYLLRLRQATTHPFLLEPAMKQTLRENDIVEIMDQLGKVGGQKPVYEQIKAWASTRPASVFGNSDFGNELIFDEYLKMALTSMNQDVCKICNDQVTNAKVARCRHTFCKVCIDKLLLDADSDKVKCPECGTELTDLRYVNRSRSQVDDDDDDSDYEADFRAFKKASKAKKNAPRFKEKRILGRDGRRLGNDAFNKQPKLKPEMTQFLRANDRRYPEPNVPSAKTTAVKATIDSWQREAPDDKIIIFVQFLEEAQILGRMLQAEGVKFIYLYGDLSIKAKYDAITGFHQDDSIKVMIASLKCGGVSLNLTCANRVILVDPWWNHAIESQAFCRVFRIGQTKETHFVTILAEDTIDMRLWQIQNDKLDNIEQALKYSKSPKGLEAAAALFGTAKRDENGNLFIECDYKN